jgi:hypothetical protein
LAAIGIVIEIKKQISVVSTNSKAASLKITTSTILETILSNKEIYLHDLMAVSKLMPYDNYTCSKNKFAFRSILLFDQTSVLDWGSNYSDHRPVLISVNLHSLCTGWLEFPQTQVPPPRIKINVENKKKMKYLEELTGKSSQKHAKTTIDNLAPVNSNSAEGRYESLKQIFVELP